MFSQSVRQTEQLVTPHSAMEKLYVVDIDVGGSGAAGRAETWAATKDVPSCKVVYGMKVRVSITRPANTAYVTQLYTSHNATSRRCMLVCGVFPSLAQ